MRTAISSYCQSGWPCQSLIDNTVTFGQPQKSIQLLIGCIRIKCEQQSDILKANRYFFGQSQCSAKVQIPFSPK
jgi:hypothetical protein